jgi:eukaryotic-like serine/threonine-protein kinase
VDAGQRVGRYIILSRLEAGTAGVVYAAYDTTLERKVALKFVAAASAPPGLAARVWGQASAMARLNHPNVVKVHDVGEHDGCAFLAMELVEGQTLAAWRRERPRSVRDVVNVMVAAARGVAAAHAVGLVHGDLKPSNILVSGSGVQVTDFAMTVAGEPVDPRTDVFAFCATLHELVRGEPPLTARVPARLGRLIAEPPASMSAVIEALLADSGARARRLVIGVAAAALVAAAFWGGKNLAGSPLRRCQAGAAAVEASWNQRVRSRLAQHFAGADQGAAWAIAERHLERYAAGWRQSHRDNCADSFGQRRQSDDVFDLRMACLAGRRTALQAFVETLPTLGRMRLASAAPASALLPALSDCDASARAGVTPLPRDPQVRQRVAATVAIIEQAVSKVMFGDYARAAELAERALAAAHQLGYKPLLARALAQAASIESRRGGASTSAGQAQEAAADRQARMIEESFVVAEGGGDDRRRAAAARELVLANLMRGRHQEAERWGGVAGAIIERIGDPADERASLAMNLGWLHLELGRRERAAAAFALARDLRRRVLPADDPEQIAPRMGLCNVEQRREAQIRCYQQLVTFARPIYGRDHPDMGVLINNLGSLLWQDRRTRGQACLQFREVMRIDRRGLEPSNPSFLIGLGNLANCLHVEGKLEDARRLYLEGLAGASAAPSLASYRANFNEDYALLLMDTGELALALRLARESLAERLTVFSPGHDRVLRARSVLAEVLVLAGQQAQALGELDEAIARGTAAGEVTARMAALHDQRGLLLGQAWGRFVDGKRAHEVALAIHDRLHTPEEERAGTRHGLGVALLGLRAHRPALAQLELALAVRATGGASSDEHADTAFALARALAAAGEQRARACQLARQAVASYAEGAIHKRQRQRQVQRWAIGRGCDG